MDKHQLSLGYGSMNSTIRFDDDQEVDLEMTTISMSAAWLINEKWAVRAVGGVLVDGGLQPDSQSTHEFDPGGLIAFGVEYRASESQGTKPSVDLSLFLGASWSNTTAPDTDDKTSYFAGDARLGARFGWIIKDKTFPYVAARVFGGPVSWKINGEDVTGTDVHHYQMAAGVGTRVGKVGMFAEWAALGEKAISLGMSTTF